ncbi:PepSY domain-containing protein [Rudaea sp.]|uniref:PepSY domain-containing protein n=1 Tax=Rudaea sp. TaxID=2136325 RepID=UPI002ED0CFC8
MLAINTKFIAYTVFGALVLVFGAGVQTSASAAAPGLLSLDEIESRASAEGVQVKDIEVQDRLVEVKGRDASAQKVKLVYDRKTGEVLSREVKAPKPENSVIKRD